MTVKFLADFTRKWALIGGVISALSGSAQACGVIPQNLHGWAVYHAGRFGLDPDLLVSLIWVESRFCPCAVSPKGALGLGQLMPGTARDLGVTDPLDPRQNLYRAAKYLRQQWDTFKDWPLALAAYNAGPGNVMAAGGVPNISETRNYVAKVLATYRALKRAPVRFQGVNG